MRGCWNLANWTDRKNHKLFMAHEQQQRCIAFGWPSSEWFCLCCLKFIKSDYQRECFEIMSRNWNPPGLAEKLIFNLCVRIYIYICPYMINTYKYFHNLIYSFQGHGEKSLCSQHSKGLPFDADVSSWLNPWIQHLLQEPPTKVDGRRPN